MAQPLNNFVGWLQTWGSFDRAKIITDELRVQRSPAEFAEWYGRQAPEIQQFVQFLGTLPENQRQGYIQNAETAAQTFYAAKAPTTPTPQGNVTQPAPGSPPTAPTTPGAPTAPGGAISPENQAAFARLSKYLADRGLGELFTVGSDGKPGGWLWNQLTAQGVDTIDELTIAIEDTAAFKRRYAVIVDLRKRAVAGEPVDVPTVDEVLAYEADAAALMRRSGLPSHLYDDYRDLQRLMSNQLSVVELEARINAVWHTVTNTSPAVRAKFAEFFGANGDAALASFLLDPDKTEVQLARMARTAYAAGLGSDFGMRIGKQRADQIAGLPITEAGMMERYQQVARFGGLYRESLGEGEDLTAEATGLDAVLFDDEEAARKLEQRLISRQGIDRATFGGAAVDRRGFGGLGASSDE